MGAKPWRAWLLFWVLCGLLRPACLLEDMPSRNPVGIPNRLWRWRGCQVRYQVLGSEATGCSVLMVHGLLVNADHWRRNLPALAQQGLEVYALDLVGGGYTAGQAPNGEEGRELRDVETELVLGPNERRRVSVPQRHPLNSSYNIFTWSEEVADFIEEVIQRPVVLVGNSLGALVSLQAALDRPELVKGLLLVNPRFRQEHVAEAPPLARPFLATLQWLLRETFLGQWLFELLGTEEAVTEILKEPYYDSSQVTKELVQVLLAPLQRPGTLKPTLEILSYSTGPLLEQLLQDARLASPVWVCWGAEDPWTPARRVRALQELPAVQRLVELPNVGHCPHDEAPEAVNELVKDLVALCAEEIAP